MTLRIRRGAAPQLVDVNGMDYMPALRASKVVVSPILPGQPIRMVIECTADVDIEALPDDITVEPIKMREPIVITETKGDLHSPIDALNKQQVPASLTREHTPICPNRINGKHVWKDDPTALEPTDRCEHCRQTRKAR